MFKRLLFLTVVLSGCFLHRGPYQEQPRLGDLKVQPVDYVTFIIDSNAWEATMWFRGGDHDITGFLIVSESGSICISPTDPGDWPLTYHGKPYSCEEWRPVSTMGDNGKPVK